MFANVEKNQILKCLMDVTWREASVRFKSGL